MNQTKIAPVLSLAPDANIGPIDEARTDSRFVVGGSEGVEIRFRGESMSLVDISASGAMALHTHWIEVRKQGILTFPAVTSNHQRPILARVVWSRYSTRSSIERPLYVSGFAALDDGEALRDVIDSLAYRGAVTYDESWPLKKRQAMGRKLAAARRFSVWQGYSNIVTKS